MAVYAQSFPLHLGGTKIISAEGKDFWQVKLLSCDASMFQDWEVTGLHLLKGRENPQDTLRTVSLDYYFTTARFPCVYVHS